MIKFQKKIIIIALITPCWALCSYIFKINFKSVAETTSQEVHKIRMLELWRYSQFIQEVKKGNVAQTIITSDGYTASVSLKNDPHFKLVHLMNDPKLIKYLIINKVDVNVIPTDKNIDISVISDTDNRENIGKAPYVTELWSYSKLVQEIDKDNIVSVTINQDVSELSAI